MITTEADHLANCCEKLLAAFGWCDTAIGIYDEEDSRIDQAKAEVTGHLKATRNAIHEYRKQTWNVRGNGNVPAQIVCMNDPRNEENVPQIQNKLSDEAADWVAYSTSRKYDCFAITAAQVQEVWRNIRAYGAEAKSLKTLHSESQMYAWLRSREALYIRTGGGTWARGDGSTYVASHILIANGTQYVSKETLDETIKEAMQHGA